MEPAKQRSAFRPIILAFILACGAATVWALLTSWIIGVVQSQMRTGHNYEALVITREGQALIESHLGKDFEDVTYRTLDGQPVGENAHGNWLRSDYNDLYLRSAHLPVPQDRSNAFWVNDQRVIGFAAKGNPSPTFWYLVKDERSQHAYMQGFDARSRQPVGYLGLSGFRAEVPPYEEQFAVDRLNRASYAGSGAYPGRMPQLYHGGVETVQPVFVMSGDQLYRADLERRTVEPIELAEPVLAVSLVSVPQTAENHSRYFEQQIAVRTAKHIFLLDTAGKTLRTVEIPAALIDQGLSLYVPLGDDFVLRTSQRGSLLENELTWINTQTGQTRQAAAQIAIPRIKVSYWTVAVTVPSLAFLIALVTILMPLGTVFAGLAPDFPTAVAKELAGGWHFLLIALVISAGLALIAYRRQLRYTRSGAAAWAIFVLLTGPAGLLGYWLHRRWPVSEHCTNCGSESPRDRDACLSCATDFPVPQLNGSEIMA